MTATARLGLTLLAGLSLAPSASSAPTVTHLFPSGGQRGTTADVTAGGVFDKWPVGVWTSSPAVIVKAAKDKGKLAVTVTPDAAPGVHWLRLYDETGASGPRPFVVGTLPEVAEKETNDEPAAAQKLDASAVVNGRLAKSGDVDCYAIPVRKGQTLVASLAAHHTLRSPIDAILQVVSPAGFVLDQNHDFRGLDPQVAYTAPADGACVVRVFAFPSTPNSSIRFFGSDQAVYRLTLSTAGVVDFPTPLAVSRQSPGKVTVHGWNIPDDRRTADLPTPTGDGVMTLTPPGVSNAVAVQVEPHPCLDLTRPSAAVPSAAPPFSATAVLAKPDAKVLVPVTAAKGEPVQIQVQSRALDLPVNPVVRVLDASGQPVARAEPAALNKDTTLAFTPPADGTYRIEVGDLYRAGSPRHAFLLRVVPVRPDFDLTVAADRFTAAAGKPLDIPVTIAPRGGLKANVDLKVVGLPDGVTTKVETGKGKATIKLTAAKPFSGPIRIEGTAAGASPMTRTASAKLADFDVNTSDLFLTVTKAK